MAMKATTVALDVKGVNKTGQVFKEIAASCYKVGKTAALIGTAAFAGAAAAFAATAKSLGALSDVAMQAGLATDEITKMSSAFGVLGIKAASPEKIATAMQKMAKSTGETGVEGFKKCIAAISEMGTVEERSAAAMATFGKAGMDFLPLIEAAAKNGVGALSDVMEAMPGISQSAADAGDACADAMQIVTDGAKALWSNAIGEIANLFDMQFSGGIREASMKAVAYVEYYSKMMWRKLVAVFENIKLAYNALNIDWMDSFAKTFTFIGDVCASTFKFLWEQVKNIGAIIRDFLKQVWSGLSGDGFSWEKVIENANFKEVTQEYWKNLKNDWNKAGSIFDGVQWKTADLSDLETTLEDRLAKAAKGAAAVGAAAVGIAAQDAAEESGEKVRTAMKQAKTELVDATSYKAATLSLRADYGKGEDRTVKAANAIKAVNQKIMAATLRTANAIEGLEAI